MFSKSRIGIKDMKDLIKYSWKASPWTLILLLVTSVIMSSLGVLEVIWIEKLFDGAAGIAEGGVLSQIYRPILGVLIILALYPLVEWLEYMARGYFWRRCSGYLKFLYHKSIGDMKCIEFEDSHNIDQLNKAGLGSSEAPDGIRVFMQIVFLYIPYILCLLVYLGGINPALMSIVVLIFIPTFLLQKMRVQESFSFQDRMGNVRRRMDYFERCIVSKEYLKETLINGSYSFFLKLFGESRNEFSQQFISIKKKILKSSLFMKSLNVLGFLGVLVLLVYLVYSGEISVGLFGAVYYSVAKITGMIRRAVEDMGNALAGISNTWFLLKRIEKKHQEREQCNISKDSDIKLKDVSFVYPKTKKKALHNINLSIKSGTSVAIVGENGAGKSTLTKIIMGLYEPTKGCVYYGKQALNEVSKEYRFEKISAVFQNFGRYKLSLHENVKISSSGSSKDTADAIRKGDICSEEKSINKDTVLSREFGGRELSGGEWQRVAIARGLYRPHNIITLDEPTSAIDPLEEARVFESFNRISVGKTCIFVTHRLGSAKIADRIIVMECSRKLKKP